MIPLLTASFFVFGLIIGSFLNVVICRFHTSKSFGGRSICLSCNEKIHWYDNIPLLSFFVLRGRCRMCGTKFSWQYPLVELLSGVIFVLLFYKFQYLFWGNTLWFVASFSFYAILFSLLVVIAAYDLRHKIIPDGLVILFGALAFAGMFVDWGTALGFQIPTLAEVLCGIAAALPFALIWLVSKGAWMGLGDAKLMLGLGWLLGPMRIVPALLVAFGLGFIFGVFMMAFSKKYNLKSEIPFAPFLIIGTLVAFFFEAYLVPLLLFF